MSIGGSKSSGKTTSTSNSSTQGEGYDYGTGMWSQQSPYLQQMYQMGSNAAGAGQDQNAQNFLARSTWGDTQGMESLQRGNAQLSDTRNMINGGIGQLGYTQGAMQGSMNLMDQSAAGLRTMLNPEIDPAMAAYSKRMGQAFNEQLLPGLKGDAMLAGGLGGSRQQIGAALGADRAMQAMSDFTANTYSGQQDRRLAAAQGLGNLGQMYQGLGDLSNQTAGMYGQFGDLSNQTAAGFGNLAQGWQQSAGTNLAQGDFARSMPWYNVNQYAGILGMPVTLDQGGFNWNNSSSTSSSSGKNSSIGGSFGLK